MNTGILDGVRVIDLSWALSGAVATQLLAEAGADVIKIEPPTGDPSRTTAGFATWNRSKRSVVLNLASPHDRAALDELLAGADVLLHMLLPRSAQRLGLDDERLGRRFPQLVSCAITGYPPGHPDADRPGYDILVQARSGLMDEQQGNREGPIFLRFPVPSWGAVYLAVAGVLARLLALPRTGRGGPVHTSLLQGALTTLTMHWARAERPDAAFAAGLPKNMRPTLFECADGVWIHLMAPTERVPLVARTLASLAPEELESARAADAGGPAYFGGDRAALRACYLRRPSGEWLEALWAADIPVLPAQRLGEILLDEQATLNGYVVGVDDQEWGRTLQAGPPVHTRPPSRVRAPAPWLGEHTDEVLSAPRRPRQATGPRRPLRWPLEGLRVLDLGNYLAGPFATMLLADLGADVIKLEAISGDAMRGVSRVFAGCQRGKRGIAVDLKNPAARPVLEALVRRADVVHHNLRAPAAARLGIDYESLRPLNPRMIYCHTSAYGPRGPRADWPGFDQLFQAYSGWEVEGGGEGQPPMWHRMGMMDHQNALASLFATLLGLWHRERTGEGQLVGASILGAATLTTSETMIFADGSIAPIGHLDADQTRIDPSYGIYRTRDGWVAVAAIRPGQLELLCKVAGAGSPDALTRALLARGSQELAEELGAAGVPAEVVLGDQCEAFFASEANRRALLAVSYPQRDLGRLEQIGSFWSFGGGPDLALRLDRAPPALGEHTGEILRELGFSEAEFEALLRSGAVTA